MVPVGVRNAVAYVAINYYFNNPDAVVVAQNEFN